MNCEICDKRASNPVKIRLEGATMTVCESCAKLGERVLTPPVFAPRHEKEFEMPKEEIVENCASIVKSAREKKGLTQEELAHTLPEKESVIHRIEQGRLIPSIELAKKLERGLGIRLVALITPEKTADNKISSTVSTIGDFIKIKKKK